MKDISMLVDENIKYNFRVGLLLEREDEVFVEFNPKIDFTTLPGGRIKALESSKEGLRREMLEEMGIEININKLKMKSLLENFFEYNGVKYHEVYILYSLKVSKNDKKYYDNKKNIDSEQSYYRWIKKDKLKEVNLLPEVLIDIAKSKEFKNVIIKDI